VKTLILCFPSYAYGIIDLGVEKIAKGLRRLTLIEDLTLEFGNSDKVTASGLKFIGKSLKKLASSLSRLRLRFIGCRNVKDTALGHLGESLKSLNRLESLDIGFPIGSMLSQPGIINFFKVLQAPLKSFRFDTAYSYLIKDQTLKRLSGVLIRNEGLQNLSCTFTFNIDTTDAGFDFLCQGIKRLENLKHQFEFLELQSPD